MPALKWMLPAGVHVKPSQFLGRRLFVFPNGTLLVKNVLPSDGGRYAFGLILILNDAVCLYPLVKCVVE